MSEMYTNVCNVEGASNCRTIQVEGWLTGSRSTPVAAERAVVQ